MFSPIMFHDVAQVSVAIGSPGCVCWLTSLDLEFFPVTKPTMELCALVEQSADASLLREMSGLAA